MPTETVHDHEIYYERAGSDGIPLVFLHGIPTNGAQWSDVQRLCAPYCRTYNVDLIGFGRSAKPLEGWEYTFENDVRILEGLVDAWGHDDVVVVGDDIGGGIALTYAATASDRVDLCVAVDPVVYDQWPVAEVEAFARWDELEGLVSDKIFEMQAQQFPMLLGLAIRRMVYRDANVTGVDMRPYREPYETVDYAAGGSFLDGDAGYGDLNLDAIRALARRAATFDPNWMIDLQYEDITSPCMIAWGREDEFMDPSARYQVKRDIRNAPVRLELIDEAGHLPMLDRPDAVADLVLDFVTEHRGVDAVARRYTGASPGDTQGY